MTLIVNHNEAFVAKGLGAFVKDISWADIGNEFRLICKDLAQFRLESLDQALKGTYMVLDDEYNVLYKHEAVVPFRKTDNHEMVRDELALAKYLIPKVEKAIAERKLTLQFLSDWGALQYASGFVLSTYHTDQNDLTADRGARKSAESRKRDKHRKFLASKLLPMLKEGMGRKAAERTLAKVIQAAVDDGRGIDSMSLAELTELLDENRNIKSTYDARKFSKSDMEKLISTQR